MDGNGFLLTCHPVDAAVALGICTQKGSWRSSPDFGTDYRSIAYVTDDTQAQVERAVLSGQPVADLIANGSIVVAAVNYEPFEGGGLLVSVDYVSNGQSPRP